MEKKAKVKFSKMTEMFKEITSNGQCGKTSEADFWSNHPEQKQVEYDESMVFDGQQCEGMILHYKNLLNNLILFWELSIFEIWN